jgi:nucleotide-binding universal stress UspA family protein
MAKARQTGLEDGVPSGGRDAGTGVAARTILLASEGRPISPQAIAKAAQLASDARAKVHVLSVARVWGSAFGLQHPGLFPSQRELQTQRDIVADAIDQLERRRVDATGEVVRSRNAAKVIAAKARERAYLAIVMTADPEPHWLIRGLLWTHEPYRVRRLAKLPVHLVVDTAAQPARGRGTKGLSARPVAER